jgi:hypothetical protein
MGWVVGIDAYRCIPAFRNVHNYVTICVNNRIEGENNLMLIEKVITEEADSPKTFLVDTEKLNISSTLIRKRVREKNSIEEFYKIISKAGNYIVEKNLWDKNDENIEKITTIKIDDDITIITQEILTSLLKQINFLTNDVKVLNFTKTLIGDDKRLSGNLILVSDIKYEPTDYVDAKICQCIVKSCDRAGEYQNFFEAYFYTNCTPRSASIFFDIYGAVNFKNKSLIFMEYFENSTCIDQNVGLNPSQTLISIKAMVCVISIKIE